MSLESRTRTNTGVGMGALLQLAGFFLAQAGSTRAILGLVLILISIPVFVWGCMNYAKGKGHSASVGWVGLAGIIGLIVLIVLPELDGDASVHRMPLGKLAGVVSMVFGLVLVVLGRWFDDLDYAGDAIPLEQPSPGVFMFLGVCLTVGSLLLLLGSSRRP